MTSSARRCPDGQYRVGGIHHLSSATAKSIDASCRRQSNGRSRACRLSNLPTASGRNYRLKSKAREQWRPAATDRKDEIERRYSSLPDERRLFDRGGATGIRRTRAVFARFGDSRLERVDVDGISPIRQPEAGASCAGINSHGPAEADGHIADGISAETTRQSMQQGISVVFVATQQPAFLR